jgi:hypothetical protein
MRRAAAILFLLVAFVGAALVAIQAMPFLAEAGRMNVPMSLREVYAAVLMEPFSKWGLVAFLAGVLGLIIVGIAGAAAGRPAGQPEAETETEAGSESQ